MHTANARFNYGTERNLATFATGPIVLTNASGASYNYDSGELVLKYSKLANDGFTVVDQRYRNVAAVTSAPGSQTSVVVEADSIGKESSIPAGATITLDPPHSGLSVVVPGDIIGRDEETDQALIERAEDQTEPLSPDGPHDAYRHIATSYKVNGAPICTKVQVVPREGLDPMIVYVGRASGGLTGPELDQINLLLHTTCVPLGVTINVVSGVEKLIRVAYDVYCRAGSPLSNETIAREINKAIDRYFADFPMGGEGAIPSLEAEHPSPYPPGTRWMYSSKLRAVIIGALDEVPGVVNPVFHATVSTTKDTNANGDIEFAPGEIAVHYLDPIASVVRV